MQIMKKIIILLLGIGLVWASSCRKPNSDISGDAGNLVLGAYVTLDSTINQNLDVSNASATVSIEIGKSVGSAVSSINIYLDTSAVSTDTTGWVLIKNVPYTAGVVLSVATSDIAKALGAAPAAGTSYTLQNQVVTTDGRTFSVYNTPSTYNSFPAYNMALTWSAVAVCAFTGGMTGSYKVIEDDWQDWVPGNIVQVTDGPGTNQINLSQVWPNPAYGSVINPLVANVDPATGAATVPKVDFGNYGYVATAESGSGYVFSCTGYITLTIDIYAAGYGDQGPKKLILQKQ
jgi:hypothetical protein